MRVNLQLNLCPSKSTTHLLKWILFQYLKFNLQPLNFKDTLQDGQIMIYNNNYLADILRVCKIKDLIWVMRFQSPLVYFRSLDVVSYSEAMCVVKRIGHVLLYRYLTVVR